MTKIKALSENRNLFRQLFIFLGLALAIILYMGCGGSSSTPPPPTQPAAPQVTGTVPTDGATGVDTNTTIQITFSKAMDEESVEDNITLSGYAGTITYSWNTGSTMVTGTLSSALDTNQTYTLTVFTNAKDQENPPNFLASPVNVAFSTGSALATGAITGTVTSDPDSDNDNDMSETVVALFANDIFSPAGSDEDPLVIVPVTSPTGTTADYTIKNLPAGTYYVVAAQNSNGDADVALENGDSIGVYQDITTYTSTGISVASTTSGIDVPLYDPEAISGFVRYAGAWTGDPNSVDPELFAFQGKNFVGGTVKLAASSLNAAQDYSELDTILPEGPQWSFWLNPFLDSTVSVTWVPDPDLSNSPTQTGLDYIPSGSYRVAAALDLGSSPPAVGFSRIMASIADTGDDDILTDLFIYDTITLAGYVTKVTSIGSSPAYYTSAMVSLLDWPLMDAPSNSDFGSSVISGFVYVAAPVDFESAIHVEPGAADLSTLLATNTQYDMFTTADASNPNDFELPLVHKDVLQTLADVFGITIDDTKAHIAGFVENDTDDPIPGLAVALSESTGTVRYMGLGMTEASSTQCIENFPQYFIFNITPPIDEDDRVNFTTGITFVDDQRVPVRAGELTLATTEVSSWGGTICEFVTLAGMVQDVGASAAGTEVSVELYLDDGTLLDSETSSSPSGSFSFEDVPKDISVSTRTSKSGYVPVNSEITAVTADVTDARLIIVPENLAKDVANAISGLSEPSWNTTLQSRAWLAMDAQDGSENDLAGVTVMSASMTVMYNDSTDNFTSTAPTVVRGSSANLPMMAAYTTTEGVYTFQGTGPGINESKDIPLLLGDVGYMIWIP